jgi:hypothetical protein
MMEKWNNEMIRPDSGLVTVARSHQIEDEEEGLFLKARATCGAGLHSYGTIVGTSLGEGAVAPAMGSVLDIGNVFGKGFVCQGGDVHFLGPNVAANMVWFHEVMRDS